MVVSAISFNRDIDKTDPKPANRLSKLTAMDEHGNIAVIDNDVLQMYVPNNENYKLLKICHADRLFGNQTCRHPERLVFHRERLFYYKSRDDAVYIINDSLSETNRVTSETLRDEYISRCTPWDITCMDGNAVVGFHANLALYSQPSFGGGAWMPKYCVPFAQRNVNSVACRAIDKNYILVMTEENVIALHGTSDKYEYIHCLQSIDCNSNVADCVYSKEHGVFALTETGGHYTIFQSPNLDAKNQAIIFSNDDKRIEDLPSRMMFVNEHLNYSDIKTITNIMFDETYGISGRLLITYFKTRAKNKISEIENEVANEIANDTENENESERFEMLQIVNQKEFDPFFEELPNYYGATTEEQNTSLFTVITIYQFLYGEQLIQNIISNKTVKQQIHAILNRSYITDTPLPANFDETTTMYEID